MLRSWVTVSVNSLRESIDRSVAVADVSGRTSIKEPWIVGHHIILAHGYASKLYREEFQQSQGGSIGITLNGDWAEPWDQSPESELQDKSRLTLQMFWPRRPRWISLLGGLLIQSTWDTTRRA